ncbi:hypothetical protein SAMN00790413_04496 [Deinococcus hopiensis KR-140]|uniref:Uncharacterized protein n=1 Tax=Deinococcus hopiensis KR-140 TaxID=695939 RepID=A0A1W1UJG8_9DEIO|nr:hypothetical protein SAMN00790413_04496 [Deinococcus hopiensis KR-140]
MSRTKVRFPLTTPLSTFTLVREHGMPVTSGS